MKNDTQALKSVLDGTSKTAQNPQTEKTAEGVTKAGPDTKFPADASKSGATTGKYKI